MELEQKYNIRNPAVKRLMREACELKEPTDEYFATPLDDNLFEWHFTVHGSPGSEFEGGIYHGRILLPTEYPMKPPNIILLTPNGRFKTNKKICLSISGHHPETWQPSWSIRTALLALIAFMSSPGNGAVGSIEYTPEERKILAKKSRDWECNECGKIIHLLSTSKCTPVTKEESDLINRINMKAEDLSKNETGFDKCEKELKTVFTESSKCKESLSPTTTENPRPLTSTNQSGLRAQSNNNNNNYRNLMWTLTAGILLLLVRRIFLLL